MATTLARKVDRTSIFPGAREFAFMNKIPAGIEPAVANIEHSAMSILGDFKAFISKGNVMDLAVGVIIGGAFQTIVTSLVKDVIMPAVGLVGGAPDFSEIAIHAHQAVDSAGKVMVNPATGKPVLEGGIMIGNFLNAVVAFLILAAVVFFLLVKPMNKLMASVNKPVPPPDAPPPPEDILLLREIRDSLKKSPAA